MKRELRGTRIVAMVTVAVLIGLTVGGLAGCSQQYIRGPVDLQPARLMGGRAPVIDAQLTAPDEWKDAAIVRVGCGKEKVRFLYDEQGIYGCVTGRDLRFAAAGEGTICISFARMTPEEQSFRLFVTSVKGGLHLTAAAGRKGAPGDPDPKLVRFAMTPMGHSKRPQAKGPEHDKPWQIEFFVSWKALAADGPPADELHIHVYRILAERPFSYVRLKAAAPQ